MIFRVRKITLWQGPSRPRARIFPEPVLLDKVCERKGEGGRVSRTSLLQILQFCYIAAESPICLFRIIPKWGVRQKYGRNGHSVSRLQQGKPVGHQSGITLGGNTKVGWPLWFLCWSRDFPGKPYPLFPIALWSGITSGGPTKIRWPLQILRWSRDLHGKPEDHFS